MLAVTIVERKSKGKTMGYNVFALCVTLTLTLAIKLTNAVELYPPKPMGTLTIYDWSFTDEETTGNIYYHFKMDIVQCFTKPLCEDINTNTRNFTTLSLYLGKGSQCCVIFRNILYGLCF